MRHKYTVTIRDKASGVKWTMTWMSESFADAEHETIAILNETWTGDLWTMHEEIIAIEKDYHENPH